MRRPGGLGCRTRCTRLPAEETGGSWARTIPARRGASAPSSRRLAGRKLAFAQQADRPEATHRLTRGWWRTGRLCAEADRPGQLLRVQGQRVPDARRREAASQRRPHATHCPGATASRRLYLRRRINWGWATVPPASAQTLPREVTFNAEARALQQYPIEEIAGLRAAAAFDRRPLAAGSGGIETCRDEPRCRPAVGEASLCGAVSGLVCRRASLGKRSCSSPSPSLPRAPPSASGSAAQARAMAPFAPSPAPPHGARPLTPDCLAGRHRLLRQLHGRRRQRLRRVRRRARLAVAASPHPPA